MDLTGKTVVLTGATGGIGSVLASKIRGRGARVLTIGRDPGKTANFHADLANRQERQKLVNTLLSSHPHLDLLIHCAGVGIYKPLEEITPADYDISLALNVEAPYFLTQALAPTLAKSKDSLVLTIGSGAGVIPMRGRSLYCATKFALRGAMLSLNEEFRGTLPRFCLISLGSTLTPFGPLSLAKKQQEALSGKAYFTPEWVGDKLIHIIEDDEREHEITLYPGDYGFGIWHKP